MADRLEFTSTRIESAEHSLFKGLDGRNYSNPQSLEQANRDWFIQNNRFISATTGKEYTDYDVL